MITPRALKVLTGDAGRNGQNGSVSATGDVERLSMKTRLERALWRVALVSMPFSAHYRPSIQLGLLKAIGESHGFPVTSYHLNLDFARQIGAQPYASLATHRGRLLGDWLFSVEAFGAAAPDPGGRFLEVFGTEIDGWYDKINVSISRDRLREIREVEVPKYLDRLLETVPWEQFQVIGFTSTFQQNTASIALARRIKERFPDITMLFGGANFEGPMGMETVRSVDVIDYAALGEADLSFPEFLIALQEGRDPAQVAGIACVRDGELVRGPARAPFEAMDTLPVPDYDEYFERVEALGILPVAGRRDIDIPFESARGCWWGAKKHCTFCGLNGSTMSFRSKTPARVLGELAEMARRYHSFRFEAVDNILDHSYFKNFIPSLLEAKVDYNLFYEVKANLSREQIKALRHAGVQRIQPGIESLNTHVLQLMRKGITGIQNVNTLRWARYYGIHVGWNLIWGFPGETGEDYRQQASLLPHLFHLQPPCSCGPVWMERFSPMFMDEQTFPRRYVRPEASYQFVYPKGTDLHELAYFFDYELEDTLLRSEYEQTAQRAGEWFRRWTETEARPSLTFWYSPDLLQIEDQRDPSAPGTYNFQQPLASIYAACSDKPQTVAGLVEQLALEYPTEEVEEVLREFCNRGLMMQDGSHFLSLALPASPGR